MLGTLGSLIRIFFKILFWVCALRTPSLLDPKFTAMANLVHYLPEAKWTYGIILYVYECDSKQISLCRLLLKAKDRNITSSYKLCLNEVQLLDMHLFYKELCIKIWNVTFYTASLSYNLYLENYYITSKIYF